MLIIHDCCLHAQTKKTDQYFLNSANNVSFFFEEDAFAEDGSLRQAKALSINKIGHGVFPFRWGACNDDAITGQHLVSHHA